MNGKELNVSVLKKVLITRNKHNHLQGIQEKYVYFPRIFCDLQPLPRLHLAAICHLENRQPIVSECTPALR